MENIPRMSRNARRHLARLGRASGDPATALRFLAVSRLAAGRSSPQVATELEVARSTVVKAAHRFAAHDVAGLYDWRKWNGAAKADEPYRRRVGEVLARTPEHFGWHRPTWTRELLCLQMQKEGASSQGHGATPSQGHGARRRSERPGAIVTRIGLDVIGPKSSCRTSSGRTFSQGHGATDGRRAEAAPPVRGESVASAGAGSRVKLLLHRGRVRQMA
jgi:hypothetical protein